MGIYARLIGVESPELDARTFAAMAQEYMVGTVTAAQFRAALQLSDQEMDEARALRDRFMQPGDLVTSGNLVDPLARLERLLWLGQVGLASEAQIKGALGL